MNTLDLIYAAIDELNESLEDDKQMAKSDDLVIFGEGSLLDSMELVQLISLVEEKLEEETGDYISIADERAMSLEESPFKTVTTLKNYIESLVNNG